MSQATDSADRIREIVRLAVPWNASIAVVTGGDDELLRQDIGSTQPVPAAAPDGAQSKREPDGAGEAIEWVEAARASGAEYLLVPDRPPWSGGDAELDRHLADYRCVVAEPGACSVYALNELIRPRARPARDGFPLPPPEMIRLTAGISTHYLFYQRFMRGGAVTLERIRAVLARNGVELEALQSVLDWGCGCGRVLRHWRGTGVAALAGSDYNPYLVRWCRDNLPFARFELNGLAPPLAFADESFDLVYAFSVFTHLPEELERPWMDELVRVTRPGGLLLLTFHGEHSAERLDEAERSRFDSGDAVARAQAGGSAGSNAFASFHPERYVRETLAAGLDVLDVSRDISRAQQAYLLRKPA